MSKPTKAEAFAAEIEAATLATTAIEETRPGWQERPEDIPEGCEAVSMDIGDTGSLRVWTHSDGGEPTHIAAGSVPSLIAWLREHFE